MRRTKNLNQINDMNIISCKCGIALDKNKLNFPTEILHDDGSVNIEKASWDWVKADYVAKVSCPVCSEDILETVG